MIAVYIAVGLFVLFLAGGFIMLDIASVRHRMPKIVEKQVLTDAGLSALERSVTEAKKWRDTKPTQKLQVVSFDGLLLQGTLIEQENAKGTLILFHGYRSSGIHDFAAALPFYYGLGYNLLLVSQRATGKSEGRYITYGVRERFDVQSWCTYLAMMFGEDHPVFLGGVSLGATTVLMASGDELYGNVRGIVADCGFTSPYEIIRKVAREDARLFAGPVMGILGIFARVFAGFSMKEWSTPEAVKNARYPILFIHGTGDSFVPAEMTQRAYDACTGEKELLLVEGAGHGQSFLADRSAYEEKITGFFRKNLS